MTSVQAGRSACPASGRRWRGHAPFPRQRKRAAGDRGYRRNSFGKNRKLVLAVGAERKRLDPLDGGAGERCIEMREELPATRDFVFQLRAEYSLIDCDENKVVLTLEVLGGGL